MSRSGLTRTKFPANDKLLPTSHATAATPKTRQFLLIGSLLCKAMIVFSRRLRLLGVVGHIDFAAATGRLETRSYQQLVREHRFHFSQARTLHPPNKSDVENHVTLCLLIF